MATIAATASGTAAASELLATESTTANTRNEAGAADRFLKLLVAQMQNQDPLNPMENAEITSQMAQIQTVTGIEKLNTSLGSAVAQISAMHNMQGAALVGRGVMLEGNDLAFDEDGKAYGGFEIDTTASTVFVSVLDKAGKRLDTIDLGAQPAGRHSFSWTPPSAEVAEQATSFTVTASNGIAPIKPVSLMHDRVTSVVAGGSKLMLELASGINVPYSQIKSFH